MGEIISFSARSYLVAKLCTYCGRRLSNFWGRFDSKVVDYLVPLAKGGEDVAENIVPSCKECHILKGDYLNYALLPPGFNRPRLIADIRRYVSEIRQMTGVKSSVMDLPGSRR